VTNVELKAGQSTCQINERFMAEIPEQENIDAARDADSSTADALWRKIRNGDDKHAAAAVDVTDSGQVGSGQVSSMDANELKELGAVSTAVRDLLDDEMKQLAPAAQAAFDPVHTRLMDAIQRSRREDVAFDGLPGVTGRAPSRQLRRPPVFSRHRQPVLMAAMVVVLTLAAGLGGHQWAQRGAGDVFPVQCLADDFDAGLKDPSPYEFVSQDPRATARWLTHQLGMPVHLPATEKAGVRLLGARRHQLHGRPMAQTHYLKEGMRIALYQVQAPKYGLGGLNEIGGPGRRHFYFKDCGGCRVVLWRVDESVMAIVTPLSIHEALDLAGAIRAASPHPSHGVES
jgi:anti-sigma factor RsiW